MEDTWLEEELLRQGHLSPQPAWPQLTYYNVPVQTVSQIPQQEYTPEHEPTREEECSAPADSSPGNSL
jgi:hypothetical protein